MATAGLAVANLRIEVEFRRHNYPSRFFQFRQSDQKALFSYNWLQKKCKKKYQETGVLFSYQINKNSKNWSFDSQESLMKALDDCAIRTFPGKKTKIKILVDVLIDSDTPPNSSLIDHSRTHEDKIEEFYGSVALQLEGHQARDKRQNSFEQSGKTKFKYLIYRLIRLRFDDKKMEDTLQGKALFCAICQQLNKQS